MKISNLNFKSRFETTFLLALLLIFFNLPLLAQDAANEEATSADAAPSTEASTTSEAIPVEKKFYTESDKDRLVFDETKGFYIGDDGEKAEFENDDIRVDIAGRGAKQLGGENPFFDAMTDAFCDGEPCEASKIAEGCDRTKSERTKALCFNYMRKEQEQRGRIPEVTDLYKVKKMIGL